MSSWDVGLLGESSWLWMPQRGLCAQGAGGMRDGSAGALPEPVAPSPAKPWRGDTEGVAGAARVAWLPVRLQLGLRPGTAEL